MASALKDAPVAWLAWVLLGLTGIVGCSSSESPPIPNCAAPTGTYELTVNPTGQSESLGGKCSVAGPALVLDISFVAGIVSLDHETCALCSTSDCAMNVLCGQNVVCPQVTPMQAAVASYVQSVEFVLPMGETDAATDNAVVEIGPNYCGYVGTAVRKGS